MSDSITATGLFTGGIVSLRLTSDADPSTWTLVRSYGALSQNIPVQSSAGEGMIVYLDDGYGLQSPLPAGQEITYVFTTGNGSTQASVTLAASLYLTSDSLLDPILRALRSAVSTVVMPDKSSFNDRATVRQAMPLTQSPPMPFISVEEVLQSQAHRQIGSDVDTDSTKNTWVMTEQSDLRYHISICARTIPERQFWKSVVLAVLKAFCAQIGPVLGQDNTVSYHIQQGQVSPEDLPPGFYFSEIGFNLSGPTSIIVKTNYDVVESFVTDMNGSVISEV